MCPAKGSYARLLLVKRAFQMEWMVCAVYILYGISVTFHWKKELYLPGFELATSGLAMEGLTTTLTHHATRIFVN